MLSGESFLPSIILGNVPGLKDILNGLVDLRTSRVGVLVGASINDSFEEASATELSELEVELEAGLENIRLCGRDVG